MRKKCGSASSMSPQDTLSLSAFELLVVFLSVKCNF